MRISFAGNGYAVPAAALDEQHDPDGQEDDINEHRGRLDGGATTTRDDQLLLFDIIRCATPMASNGYLLSTLCTSLGLAIANSLRRS